MPQAPPSLDPVHASTVEADHLVDSIYDTLYAWRYLERPYALKPNLADGLPEVSDDGLVYTIRLKSGVRFADDDCFPGGLGRTVVAGDVVYSLKRHFDPATRPQGAWLWAGRIAGLDDWKTAGADYDAPVTGLEAPDAQTLIVRLTAPFPQLPQTLAQGFSAVVPREVVECRGRDFSRRPAGSGPFLLESLDETRAVLVANPAFRREPFDPVAEGFDAVLHGELGIAALTGRVSPFVDRVVVDFATDPAARWLSFAKGDEIQFAEIPPEQAGALLEPGEPVRLKKAHASDYRFRSQIETGFVFTGFNMNDARVGYHDDPVRNGRNRALRCAMMRAFDWNERNERFYYGRGVVFPGVIPPSVAAYDPALPRDSVTLDLAAARALLVAYDWHADNLPVLTYGTVGGPTLRLFFEQIRGWMGRIGYPQERIVLRQYAGLADLKRAWQQGELPLVTKAWILDYPDAGNALALFYGPNRSPGANDTNYNNVEYDKLYEQAAVLPPSPERTALYQAMNRMVIDDCVVMSGLSRTRLLAWHADVIAFPDVGMAGGFALRYVARAKPR